MQTFEANGVRFENGFSNPVDKLTIYLLLAILNDFCNDCGNI